MSSPSPSSPSPPGRRSSASLLLLAGFWLLTVLVAPLVGPQPLDFAGALTGVDPLASTILWQLRVPRVLLALIVGAILALSGLCFQTLFRNSLAEPYTLGVASGAALGVALVFVLGVGLAPGLPWLGAAGFGGALVATGLVLALAKGRRDGPNTLLLAGVAVALTTQALIVTLQYFSDATQTLRIVRWMMGGLGIVGFAEVLWLLPWLLILVAIAVAHRSELDLLLAGEEIAAARGADLPRLRLWILGGASLAVGAMVAVAGPIGFVGLVAPHVARRWVGSGHRRLIPATLLFGSAFLTLCDVAARTLLAPTQIPVGVVTALLGGPFFLWILKRSG
ncbi:MAG: iron ABC transporter permease [Thermoanaerobaculia bacterium]|nr:iron ABC transporter permease [Thermoanaerobaculia bacterium]